MRTAPNHLYLKKESDFYEPRQPTIPSFTNLSLECTSSKRASTSSTRERERERPCKGRKESSSSLALDIVTVSSVGIYATLPVDIYLDTRAYTPLQAPRTFCSFCLATSVIIGNFLKITRPVPPTLRHLYPHK